MSEFLNFSDPQFYHLKYEDINSVKWDNTNKTSSIAPACAQKYKL